MKFFKPLACSLFLLLSVCNFAHASDDVGALDVSGKALKLGGGCVLAGAGSAFFAVLGVVGTVPLGAVNTGAYVLNAEDDFEMTTGWLELMAVKAPSDFLNAGCVENWQQLKKAYKDSKRDNSDPTLSNSKRRRSRSRSSRSE